MTSQPDSLFLICYFSLGVGRKFCYSSNTTPMPAGIVCVGFGSCCAQLWPPAPLGYKCFSFTVSVSLRLGDFYGQKRDRIWSVCYVWRISTSTHTHRRPEQQNEYLCNSSVLPRGKVSPLCLEVFNRNKPTCCSFNPWSEMVKHLYLIKKQISALLIKNSEN